MEIDVTDQFAALSHPQRLSVLRLLMRRHPDLLPAGQIATVLSIKPNTLSSYLSHLLRAGLVTQARNGTSLRYGVDLPGVRHMTDTLLNDCCRGRPDLCPPIADGATNKGHAMPPRKYRVLFICTGNSARSIFAESILNALAGDRFEAFSAGTKPTSALNPIAVEMLAAKGYDTNRLSSKNITAFQGSDAPWFDFVFTVCDRAANEDCPTWPGQPLTAHWGTADPVKANGTDAQKMLAFQQAYGALRQRITAFSALPFDTLDRMSLQTALDDIARMETPE
jgi:arsenate reductase